MPEHQLAYVWAWLPGEVDPVPAGRLDDRNGLVTFSYSRRYRDRPDAISLYEPELPLVGGEQPPLSGSIAGCIDDAGPDSWGQRVIERRRTSETTDLGPIGYLLESGSDRIGALDFQTSPVEYHARALDEASLEDLVESARAVDEGTPLPETLDLALMHGSSVGGARPKVLLHDHDGRRLIAKLTSSADPFPIVKAEYVAMQLARRAGLDVARVDLTTALGREVLLVERFDRTAEGHRRMIVSAMTILELHDADGLAGRDASYVELADHIRARFVAPDTTLRELFSRLTFNILVGNNDDHARNHAAFWDGHTLTLTPAYDICPQPRTGNYTKQAMAFGRGGERESQVARALEHCGDFHLGEDDARSIVARQIAVIRREWDAVCDAGGLSRDERDRLRGRQFLNPFALEGFADV